MKIYLDNCALGRLFDDQSQPRIAAEALAIDTILRLVTDGQIEWCISAALREEINNNSDLVRRSDTLRLLTRATETLSLTHAIQVRSQALESQGFTRHDAQHVAFAEAAKVNALLTTDDRLNRLATRLAR